MSDCEHWWVVQGGPGDEWLECLSCGDINDDPPAWALETLR